MKDADLPEVEVRQSAARVEERGFASQTESHRVHGEVPTPQILLDRARLGRGQGAWARVRLPARCRQIEAHSTDCGARRAKPTMGGDPGMKQSPPRQDDGVTLDRKVDVYERAAKHQISHRPAHGVHVMSTTGRAHNSI